MASDTALRRGGEDANITQIHEWREFEASERVFVCRVVIVPEEEGGFSVFAATLPGIASQGDTIEECVENITDALKAAIGYYLDEGIAIPWVAVDVGHGKEVVEKAILIHA